jgi:hypothetical protein
MEIRISPENMLKVLVDAGMDTTEAKAIILDLLMYTDIEQADPRRKLEKAVSTRQVRPLESRSAPTPAPLQPKVKVPAPVPKVENSPLDETDEDDEDEDDDESLVMPRTKIKKTSRRLNFSAFGGTAQPLK